MESVEIKGLVDVLVLSFGLTVGRAVVARVVQRVDLTVFTSGYKRVLLNGVQVLCSTDQKEKTVNSSDRQTWNQRKRKYE